MSSHIQWVHSPFININYIHFVIWRLINHMLVMEVACYNNIIGDSDLQVHNIMHAAFFY